MTAKHSQPEFELACAVADHIRKAIRPGVFWSGIEHGDELPKKQNKRGIWYAPGVERRKRIGVRNGLPDQFFIVKGRSVGMELKTATDKVRGVRRGVQSDDQEKVEEDWTLAGGLYKCCYGYQEAIDFLEVAGVLRPDKSVRRVAAAA